MSEARGFLDRFSMRRKHDRHPLMAAHRADRTFCRSALYTMSDADRMHAALEAVLRRIERQEGDGLLIAPDSLRRLIDMELTGGHQ